MFSDVQERTLIVANFLIENNTTIRAAAKEFNISKSTVHYDLSKRLKKYNINLYENVKKILDYNFAQKHIRGGIATKNKYIKIKNKQKNN